MPLIFRLKRSKYQTTVCPGTLSVLSSHVRDNIIATDKDPVSPNPPMTPMTLIAPDRLFQLLTSIYRAHGLLPAGGREKLIGNNPQSWAAPTSLTTPYVLDFAHSAVARGKIYLAREVGEAIPVGWALDGRGRPTSDPSEAIAGTLLPMAGHKGAGLAAMMDVLSGLLSGSAFGSGVTGPYVADQRSGAGHFLMAINIASLRPLDTFLADMQAMIASWKASAPRDGVADILFPGEPKHHHEQTCRAAGIALPERVVDTLVTRAQELGITITPGDLKA